MRAEHELSDHVHALPVGNRDHELQAYVPSSPHKRKKEIFSMYLIVLSTSLMFRILDIDLHLH